MKKLILFDIDGTILFTHGVGRRSVEAAMERVLGRPISSEAVRFSGKTDPQILREIVADAGLEDLDEATFQRLLDTYTEEMRTRMRPEKVDMLPGVAALVERLHHHDAVQLGLLTGNLEPLAYLKLQYVNLDHYFPVGAFGSDSAVRNELPTIAMERAARWTGARFGGENTVIIGDTEYDVLCGRHACAATVAVCTGNYSREQLHTSGADVVLDDLSDTEYILREVLHL